MSEQYEALFKPLKIGGITIKNRIVLCAMEGTNIVEGIPSYKFNEHCHEYYLDRAKNNVGLMIPGMVPVLSFASGKPLSNEEKTFMGPVKDLMDEIHSYGSKVFLQLGAGMGRSMLAVPMLRSLYYSKFKRKLAKGIVGLDVDKFFRSPSAGLPNVWDTNIKSTEMSIIEIQDIIKAYGTTAELCKRAGVDGVEVHAVHEGYLLDQFSMECTNQRKDQYGGSLENRLRFVCEIIAEIKKVCGPDYPVSVRYSVESKMIGFNEGALPGEEYKEFGRDLNEGIAAAKILEAAGADMLDADNGTYDSWYWAHPPLYMPLSCNLDSAAAIKPHVNIPVICAGRMENPDTAAEALESGKIDGIGIARQLLCDAEYATKVKEGRIDDIRPCIACHNGCFGVSKYKGNPGDTPKTPMGHCALNPVTLAEHKYKIEPAAIKKKIAIIGGGIGGMEVARLSALRGHDVKIYEKSGELGGVFIAAGAPDFKEKDKMLLKWYQKQISDLGIEVKFNVEISNDELNNISADEVIIATGAIPRNLPVPHSPNGNIMEAIEYLRGYKEVTGENVAVIGGGLTGCEIAYDLIRKGKQPVIIEMQDDILKVKDLSAANSNFLRDAFLHNKTPIYLESKVMEITSEGVVVETAQGKKTIPADTVITSTGYTPAPLQSNGRKAHIIGDAAGVGNLRTVIWGAYDVALKF